MGQQTEIEPGLPRKQADRQVERYAVDGQPQELTQPDVAAAHERQRRQEMLAELAIGDPRIAFPIDLERQGVDQERAAAMKLNVVGAGVLERKAARQRPLLDIERREGR